MTAARPGPWARLNAHLALPPFAVDLAIFLVCLALGATTLRGLGQPYTGDAGILIHADLLGVIVLLVGTLPVLVRRRWPFAALLVAGGVDVLLAFTDVADTAAWLVATLTCAYSLAALGQAAERRVGGALVVITAVAGATVGLRGYGDDWLSWLRAGAFELVAFGVVWYLGAEVRRRRAESRAFAGRAERAEAEAAEAAAGERARIARELHDLVGHAISVITVQASVGEHLADTQPELAKQSLATIQEVSRQAMTEMRHLVGVLRSEDGSPAGDGSGGAGSAAELGPQPGVDDVAALVEDTRRAGVEVDYDLEGERDTPPGVGLAVYRIVQESVANARKHAPGAAITILVRRGPAAVAVEVRNGPAAAGADTSVADVLGSSGFGIVGMRERVAVYDGRLEADATDDGGFLVRATLPYDDGGRG